ncbi:hypothetical protein [Litoribacillus peritrichatus]|uniref:Uncharacterized protein n=1 Tax=Litoribacillus peritrichatus TaxID=718191 RepID=A0ABP7N218_9GAMM
MNMDLTVGQAPNPSNTKMFEYSSTEDLIKQLDNDNLKQDFSNYQEDFTFVDSTINYRSLPMRMTFQTNSQTLIFSIPDLGINEQFDGQGDRDNAIDQLLDYLKGKDSNTANKINRKLVEISPSSPIAGNPSAMMNMMVDSAFDAGVGFDRSQANIAASDLSDENRIGIGIDYAQYDQAGQTSDNWTLPLKYTWADENGRNLTIDLPLSYNDTEGSETYKARLGITYQFPVNANWLLTPVLDYGVTASEDLYDGAQMISGAITSMYTFDPLSVAGDEISVSIGNMAGYYKTLPLDIDDYEVDPDITNQVTKNGVLIDTLVDIFSYPANVQYILTDSRYFGDEVYADNFNEIGFSVRPAHTSSDFLALTFLYIASPSSEDISGFKGKLFYSF